MKTLKKYRIDKIVLFFKIVIVILLILTIYVNMRFGSYWQVYLYLAYTGFIILFLADFKKIFYKYRNWEGIRNTTKKNLKEEFLKQGGIIGYKPIEESHIALIFISNSSKNYGDICYDEFSPFIEHYNKTKVAYHLYFCSFSEDFIKLVQSKNIYGLHIYGHGRIDSVRFEDGILQYRELKHTEPKEFVAQWHCNHGDGVSLGELIGKEYFVPYGMIFFIYNNKRAKELISGKRKWTINEKLK